MPCMHHTIDVGHQKPANCELAASFNGLLYAEEGSMSFLICIGWTDECGINCYALINAFLKCLHLKSPGVCLIVPIQISCRWFIFFHATRRCYIRWYLTLQKVYVIYDPCWRCCRLGVLMLLVYKQQVPFDIFGQRMGEKRQNLIFTNAAV